MPHVKQWQIHWNGGPSLPFRAAWVWCSTHTSSGSGWGRAESRFLKQKFPHQQIPERCWNEHRHSRAWDERTKPQAQKGQAHKTPDSMSALASQLTRRPDHLRLAPSHGRQGTWQCPKKVLLTSRGRFNVKWPQSKGQDSETIKPHV